MGEIMNFSKTVKPCDQEIMTTSCTTCGTRHNGIFHKHCTDHRNCCSARLCVLLDDISPNTLGQFTIQGLFIYLILCYTG